MRSLFPLGCIALLALACSREAPAPSTSTESAPATAVEPAPPAAAVEPAAPAELVLYVGRNLSLVTPLIEKFEKAHQIDVKTRDGSSSELAALLVEEGGKSPADVFWAQDADSLALVASKGLFAPIPDSLKTDALNNEASALFAGRSPHWIPLSGRARVLAYSPKKFTPADLPKSVMDLTDPKYAGLIGWAPTNASFQIFVTALRVDRGEEAAEAWLRGVKANGAKTYAKNTPIIQAIAAEEIALGLPNHYYLIQAKADAPDFPVEQAFFADGDIGNLLNVSGAGILASAKNRKAAEALLTFLASTEAQQYFATETYEYPVRADIAGSPRLVPLADLPRIAPKLDLDRLGDLEGTLALLRKVGLL